MDVKVIPAEKWKRYIEVTVPAEEVEVKFNESLKRYQKRAQVQGFRKGKAPLPMVKQMYGGAIRQETLEEMVPEILAGAREKNRLKTLGAANVEDMKYDEKEGLRFRASVEVTPEIELRQYKGFEFEKTIYAIDELDVAEALDGLREQHSSLKKVEDGEAKDGHIVSVDLQQIDSTGVPLLNEKFDNQRFVVAAGDEFTGPLVGAKIGEARRSSFTPKLFETVTAENSQPKFYQITVKEITEKILPPLDDSFASGYKVQTIDELKADLRKHLAQRAEQRSREDLRHEIIDELIKVNAFELPEAMAESYIEKFFESLKGQFAGIPEETLKESSRAAALRRLRWQFLRERLVAAENLDVADEELRNTIVSHALAKKEEPQRMINQIMHDDDRREKLRDDLLEAKVLNFLEGQMKLRERYAPYKDRGPQRIITV